MIIKEHFAFKYLLKSVYLQSINLYLIIPAREGELRLVNQVNKTTGQLQILIKEKWQTICGYQFNMKAANVACRQLGFLKAEKIQCCSRIARNKTVYMRQFSCMGDEKELLKCRQRYQMMCTYLGNIEMSLSCSNGQCQNGKLHCSANATCVDTAAISYCQCPNGYYGSHCNQGLVYYGDLRLTYSNFGRVELYSNGTWNSICFQGFTPGSALVICRQLHFKSYKSFHVSYQSYAAATGGIMMDNLNCTGNELTILDCSYNLNTNCDHSQTVAVECTSKSKCLLHFICILLALLMLRVQYFIYR